MNALKWGIVLGRSNQLKLPQSLSLHGVRGTTRFPDERGVRVAFDELLFADGYGLKQVPGPVSTVLDIGGNVGIFTLAARKAFRDATIHTYEPNPQLEPYLRAQAKIANATVFMEAVSDEDGVISLDVHDDSVQTRSHHDEKGTIVATAFRKTIERIGGQVDLVKIDCEGAEWDLFKDAASWQKIKHLTMEYHLFNGQQHDEIPVVLERLGFAVTFQDRAYPTCGIIRATRRT